MTHLHNSFSALASIERHSSYDCNFWFHFSELPRKDAEVLAIGDDIQLYVITEERRGEKKMRGSKVTIVMTVKQKALAAREKAVTEVSGF